MKVGLIKKQRREDSSNHSTQKIDKVEKLFLPTSQGKRRFKLSLRSPVKTGKVDIRQLFKDDKIDGIPIFPYPSTLNNLRQWELPSRDIETPSPRKVQFKIRNLFSRSTQISSRGKKLVSTDMKSQRYNQNQSPCPSPSWSRDLQVESLHELQQNFIGFSEQLGFIANLRDGFQSRIFKELPPKRIIKIEPERVSKTPRQVIRSKKQSREKADRKKTNIIPWEKSFQTEQDNFLQN